MKFSLDNWPPGFVALTGQPGGRFFVGRCAGEKNAGNTPPGKAVQKMDAAYPRKTPGFRCPLCSHPAPLAGSRFVPAPTWVMRKGRRLLIGDTCRICATCASFRLSTANQV